MAEKKMTNKGYNEQAKAFVDKLKDMLDLEIQVMELKGEDKTNKKEYQNKISLLNYAIYKTAEETLSKVVSEELLLAKKEDQYHDHDKINYYDIAQGLMPDYDARIQTAKVILVEYQSKKPLIENIKNQGVALEESNIVGIAKGQGLNAEVSNGFSDEIPNNVTPEVVARYLASRQQNQGRKQ